MTCEWGCLTEPIICRRCFLYTHLGWLAPSSSYWGSLPRGRDWYLTAWSSITHNLVEPTRDSWPMIHSRSKYWMKKILQSGRRYPPQRHSQDLIRPKVAQFFLSLFTRCMSVVAVLPESQQPGLDVSFCCVFSNFVILMSTNSVCKPIQPVPIMNVDHINDVKNA